MICYKNIIDITPLPRGEREREREREKKERERGSRGLRSDFDGDNS